MENFADYILTEEDFKEKIEIAYYLHKKENTVFDNSVIFKASIVKMFIDSMNINVDCNLVVTAMLLCGCKKVKTTMDIDKIKNYAKESAEYLETLGFSKRFCKICEEHNRYSGSSPREKESDILELCDQFGAMLMGRPERTPFPIDETLTLLEHRNLKNVKNIYLEKFKEFGKIAEEAVVCKENLEDTESLT